MEFKNLEEGESLAGNTITSSLFVLHKTDKGEFIRMAHIIKNGNMILDIREDNSFLLVDEDEAKNVFL